MHKFEQKNEMQNYSQQKPDSFNYEKSIEIDQSFLIDFPNDFIDEKGDERKCTKSKKLHKKSNFVQMKINLQNISNEKY